MFDILQIIFWAITYLLLITDSLKNKTRPFIPALAVVLNFAWEAAAFTYDLTRGGLLWAHALWLGLDVVIVCLMAKYRNGKKRLLFLLLLLFTSIALIVSFQLWNIHLISVFTIDLIMAIAFLVELTRGGTINLLRCVISFTKLLGDLFAWIYYREQSTVVNYIGAIVLLINLFHFAFALMVRKGKNAS